MARKGLDFLTEVIIVLICCDDGDQFSKNIDYA